MDHGQLSMVADQFHWVVAAALRNACGTDVQVCRRQRVITPLRLGLALTATCASQPGETSAACHCGCHARCGTPVTSQACSHQVAQPHGAALARTMTARLLRARTLQGLGGAKGHALAALRHLVRQAGSACALPAGVRAVWPGRCTVVTPAAVARPTTLELRGAPPPTVVLLPDTTRAQAFVPEPTARRDRGLLAARGARDVHSRQRGPDAGGVVLLRATAGRPPQGHAALRAAGNRVRSRRHTPLPTIHATRPTRQRVARGVRGHVDGHPLGRRLVSSGQRRTTRCGSVLTHLAPQRDPRDTMCRASPWRGPVA